MDKSEITLREKLEQIEKAKGIRTNLVKFVNFINARYNCEFHLSVVDTFLKESKNDKR